MSFVRVRVWFEAVGFASSGVVVAACSVALAVGCGERIHADDGEDTGAAPSAAGSPSTAGFGAGGSVNSGTAGAASQSGAAGTAAPPAGASSGGSVAGGASGTAAAGAVSGASGSSQAAGAGGAAPLRCNPGAPTPATPGVNFPFPQNRLHASCIYPPSCNASDATAGWQAYKQRLIVDGGDGSLRVQRPEFENDTVSEGMAYGMLFAVYLNDKPTFDKLWQYVQKYLDGNGLMHWRIDAGGEVTGANSATDSDEDMAFALVMADKQWGGYTSVANAFLEKVSTHDFHEDGSIRGGDAYDEVNPSYLAPAFYRAFAAYTGNARWTTILEKSYETLNGAAHAMTGLVPDWSSGDRGRTYTYDAARTPYRIALDACWNNEPRAKAYTQKIGAFFASVGVANIRDGFELDGRITGIHNNATFIGPAGVAGMVASEPQLVSEAYARVATDLSEGTENYYNLSWALFSALLMTGNFANLAQP